MRKYGKLLFCKSWLGQIPNPKCVPPGLGEGGQFGKEEKISAFALSFEIT
jgi:hypothetical protein